MRLQSHFGGDRCVAGSCCLSYLEELPDALVVAVLGCEVQSAVSYTDLRENKMGGRKGHTCSISYLCNEDNREEINSSPTKTGLLFLRVRPQLLMSHVQGDSTERVPPMTRRLPALCS